MTETELVLSKAIERLTLIVEKLNDNIQILAQDNIKQGFEIIGLKAKVENLEIELKRSQR